jgi:hypothetical protein
MADDYFKSGNWNRKDEYYTPSILVEPVLEFIPAGSVIWCPFDTPNSEFVLMLTEAGHQVKHSHISGGRDFFNENVDCDYIISNPPFTKKLQVLDRLFAIGKPFAMILGLPILNYQNVGNFFYQMQQKGKNLQLLIVDKKVSFDGNTASFNNSYFCHNFLPRDIIFKHLEHNNSNKNFISSRMAGDF